MHITTSRQFLFRPPDVGKPKAEVAAAFINKRVKGCTVTPHFGAVQDKDRAFYDREHEAFVMLFACAHPTRWRLLEFPLIICGLDSIKARRWMNSLVVRASTTLARLPGPCSECRALLSARHAQIR